MASLGEMATNIAKCLEIGEIRVTEARREFTLLTGEENPVVRVKKSVETFTTEVPVMVMITEFHDGTRKEELEDETKCPERIITSIEQQRQALLRPIKRGKRGVRMMTSCAAARPRPQQSQRRQRLLQ